MRDERGLTTLEVMLIMPFVLFFLLAGATVVECLTAQTVVTSAAREAARTMAVYHDEELAREKAAEVVSKCLPVPDRKGKAAEAAEKECRERQGTGEGKWRILPVRPGHRGEPPGQRKKLPPEEREGEGQLYIGKNRRPEKQACTFDPSKDVKIYDDGKYCTVNVEYHVRTLCPGLPVLLEKDAAPWAKYVTTAGHAVFNREFE